MTLLQFAPHIHILLVCYLSGRVVRTTILLWLLVHVELSCDASKLFGEGSRWPWCSPICSYYAPCCLLLSHHWLVFVRENGILALPTATCIHEEHHGWFVLCWWRKISVSRLLLTALLQTSLSCRNLVDISGKSPQKCCSRGIHLTVAHILVVFFIYWCTNEVFSKYCTTLDVLPHQVFLGYLSKGLIPPVILFHNRIICYCRVWRWSRVFL